VDGLPDEVRESALAEAADHMERFGQLPLSLADCMPASWDNGQKEE